MTQQPVNIARHPNEDRSIRLLFMADHLGHSRGRIHGGTTYFLNTIPALKDAGVDIDVVFLGPPHPMASQLEARGVVPKFLSLGKYDLGSYGKCKHEIHSKKYDLVHLHSFKSHFLGRLAVYNQTTATIVHVHDQSTIKQPLKFFQGLLGKSTSALLGVSDSVTEFARKEYKVPANRCSTLYNGIDIAPFETAHDAAISSLRQEVGVDADRRVILVAGRLIPGKGHLQLFEAMKLVNAAHPLAELWVVGDGDSRAEYQEAVAQHGLENAVRFLGQRTDMPDVFAAADLLVVPSMVEEGFGLVALEAAATHVPVVAFETGGISAIVKDGETGILVPRGDVTMLANAMSTLLTEDTHRQALGRGGAALARTFTIDIHTMKLALIYQDLLQSHSSNLT